jgi:hypothetical protein
MHSEYRETLCSCRLEDVEVEEEDRYDKWASNSVMRNENVILVAKILSCHANQVEGWN